MANVWDQISHERASGLHLTRSAWVLPNPETLVMRYPHPCRAVMFEAVFRSRLDALALKNKISNAAARIHP